MTGRTVGPSFTGAQVAAYRLLRHHLDARAPRHLLETVVGSVCGVQAQLMVMARLALWARVNDLTIGDVERALWRKRSIVKSWSMRGTLHLHRSSDLLLYLRGLIATRLPHEQRWIKRVGLDEEEITAFIVNALKDGPLTRGQLVERLDKRLGATTKDWKDTGWGTKRMGASVAWHLVRPAVARGLVCFGPTDGQGTTFVRVDQWLRKPPSMPAEEEAEEALLRRYLHAYGPADAHDFRAWAAVRVRRILAALERLGDELVEVGVDGGRGFLLRKDLPPLEEIMVARGMVRLLPSFDPFMLGHRDRVHLVDRTHYKRVYKEAGWLSPVVLLDGYVAGTWSYLRRSGRLVVEVRMFNSVRTGTRRGIQEEARDLARFLEARGLDLRIS